MSRRKPARHNDLQEEEPEPQADEQDAWNTPQFRNSVLRDLAFVALPAILMVVLGEPVIAAAWFSVGLLAVFWQSWPQIRALWRSFRSSPATQAEGQAKGEGGPSSRV